MGRLIMIVAVIVAAAHGAAAVITAHKATLAEQGARTERSVDARAG